MKQIIHFDKKTISSLSTMLADAFIDSDPVVTHWLPENEKHRKEKLVILYKILLRHCLNYGSVYTDEKIKACVLFFDSYSSKTASFMKFVVSGGLRLFLCGIRFCFTLLSYSELLDSIKFKLFADVDFSYLYIIAVDPRYQNMGLGSAILKPLLKDCDTKRKICLLETRKELIPYYEKFDFHVFKEMNVPKTDILECFMSREPQK